MSAQTFVSFRMAWRFFCAKNRRILNFLYILASATGLCTLLAVLGIINSLQQDIIENLIRYQSFHFQIADLDDMWLHQAEHIRHMEHTASVTPFLDLTAFVHSEGQGFTLRAVPDDYFPSHDAWDQEFMYFSRDFHSGNTIVLTRDAASMLDKNLNDTVSLLLVPEQRNERILQKEFQVVGIMTAPQVQSFIFGYIRLSSLPRSYVPVLGVMLTDLSREQSVSTLLRTQFPVVRDWRDLNRDILNALHVEKLFLILLITLIFLVMGFNSYQLFRRAVLERLHMLALFQALGIRIPRIRRIFSLEGFIIGFVSTLVGGGLGLFITVNLATMASLINTLLENLRYAFSLLFPFLRGVIPRWEVLPWIQERGIVSFWELSGAFFISCMIPFVAALLASSSVATLSPADIMRKL